MTQPTVGTNVICQVAIVVKDIEKTAKAWQEVLGLPEARVIVTDPAEKSHIRYRGQPTEARAKLAFFQMGEQLSVELIEPIGGPSTWQEHLDARGEGVHHIAFRVKGMDQVVADLAAKGVPTVQRGDYTGGRYAYCDSIGPLKVVLELLENFGK